MIFSPAPSDAGLMRLSQPAFLIGRPGPILPIVSRSPLIPHRLRAAAAAFGLALLAGCVPREEGGIHLRASFWNPPGVDQEIARRFEALHPGVKVELLVTGGRYAEKLQSMIVAGNEPDVMMAHDTFYHDWAARGVFADLTDFVRAEDQADPLMPGVAEVFSYEGRIFALPVDCNAMVTFGSSTAAAYAGVPWPWKQFTWDELEKLGPQLSRRDNPGSPTEYLCALPQPPFFFTAFGGRCFDDLHHPRAVTVESPVTVAAMAYWRRLHQRGWAVPRSTLLDQGESEMFRDGRIAFLFWGRAVVRTVRANAGLRWDIAPVPAGPAGRSVPHLTMAVGISRHTKHPELAREFVRFYASDAGVEYPVRIGQIVPVRRRQATGEMFLGQHPPAATGTFVDAMENGITAVAYCPGRQAVEEIITKRFEQVLAEPDVPVERIAAGLAADLREWLRQMQQKGYL
jgi:multiple sugar transport system substrate-binding protein